MVDVVADDAVGREGGADPVRGVAGAEAAVAPGSPDAVLVAYDSVLDQVVGHSNEEDACEDRLVQPVLRASLVPGADHDVLLDGVVHLVAVLRVDADAPRVEDRVLLHEREVRAVDRDAHLLGLLHGVALEDAAGAVPHPVEVQAVTPKIVPLAAKLYARVADVRVAGAVDASVEALLGLVEVLVVPRDEDAALQVDDLRGHLEARVHHQAVAAPVLVRQGRVEVHEVGAEARDAVHRGVAP
mmetsp:Transcript_100532/g.293061  ORF Transcript_100532/g.293061 Transcript_100532/m.293061 type:complete len:242 (+) Transcript_100532:933-1658(+)